MKIIADTHTHTMASTHAYSTAIENIKHASDIGLKCIALTDHCPALEDAPHLWHFYNIRVIPEHVYGVRVLRGAEANILDKDGTIDLDEVTYVTLEWIVASFHENCCKPMSLEDCTSAYIGVANNPHVDVIGHSGLEDFKYDYEKVIPIFKEKGKLVELNHSTFFMREKSKANCLEIAKICKRIGAPVVVNSDAHFALNVGNVDNVFNMLKDIDFPEELIVNADEERFNEFLKRKKNRAPLY